MAFYQKILNFLTPLLKECSENMEGELETGQMEAFRALYRYFRLIELSLREFQNYSYFNSHSGITILKNYRESQIGMKEVMLVKQEVKSFDM